MRPIRNLCRHCFVAFVTAVVAASSARSAPGGFDTTFGDGGVVGFSYGAALRAVDPMFPHAVWLAGGVLVERNGAILVSGYHLPWATASTRPYGAVVARRLRNGAADTAFGSAVGLSGLTAGVAERMVRQSDGRIVFEITIVGLGYNYHLQRMSADGVPDPTFPPSYPAFGFAGAKRLTLAGGDRLLVAGFRTDASTGEAWQIHRLERDGQADATFGTGGIAAGAFPGAARAAVEDAAGRVVAAGYASAAPTRAVVRRYLADGAVDPAFGTGGAATLPVADAALFTSLAVQPDGRIVVAGSIGSAPPQSLVARFLADGSPDPSFGTAGYAAGDFPMAIEHLVVQSSGQLVVAGSDESTSPWRALVARYRPDGRPDASFGAAGMVSLPGCDTRSACTRGLALAADGKIVVLTNGRVAGASDDGILFRLLGDDMAADAPIPALSPLALLLASAVLGVAGAFAVRRR